MTGYLTELTTDALPPGRYRLTVPAPIRSLRDELSAAGATMRVVDGAVMVDRAALFDEFATACDFPGWFGGNWDAFADCLRDLSWLPQVPTVVLWLRAGAVDPELAHDAGRVIDAAIAARVSVDLPALDVIYPAPAGDGSVGGPRLRPVR